MFDGPIVLARFKDDAQERVAAGAALRGLTAAPGPRTALGSARETVACLLVAERFGYVEAMPEVLVARMNRVVGTLVRVAA
jgi:hypothetical protein